MAFRKIGEAQQLSVHDPKTGVTNLTCPKCGKNTPVQMTKKAYVGGISSKGSCGHCGESFGA